MDPEAREGEPAMTLIERVESVLGKLERAQWLPQLLVRLFVGYFFLETGWGKVNNIEGMTERFTDWGIPFAHFNAVLSGYTELIGGTLVLVGLFTRVVSIPMIINMMVAVVAVKLKKVTGLDDFVELDEPLYALFFFWLIFSGAGLVSLDHFLWRFLTRKGAAPQVVKPA
jgi:putative oxidoreductase